MNNFYCRDLLCSEGAKFNLLNVQVRNSILVGSSSDEVWMIDAFDPAGELFNVTMQNNIVVVDDLLDPENFPGFFGDICDDCFDCLSPKAQKTTEENTESLRICHCWFRHFLWYSVYSVSACILTRKAQKTTEESTEWFRVRHYRVRLFFCGIPCIL